MNFSGSQTVELDGKDFEVSFDVEADMTYCPAQVSGPPENCYPDESECDITDITLTEVTFEGQPLAQEANQVLWATLKSKLDEDKMIEKAWEKYQDREEGEDY